MAAVAATDWALLVLRIVIGVVYLAHGWPKLLGHHAGHFKKNRIPFPKATSIAIGALEVFGGILIAVGFLVRPLNVLLACTMIFAIVRVKWARGFVNESDFPLIMLAVDVALAITGSGQLGIDSMLGW